MGCSLHPCMTSYQVVVGNEPLKQVSDGDSYAALQEEHHEKFDLPAWIRTTTPYPTTLLLLLLLVPPLVLPLLLLLLLHYY